MAVSEYTITFIKSALTDGVTDLYIDGRESLYDNSYHRLWIFKTNGQLPVTYNGTWDKLCWVIEYSGSSNQKLKLIGILNGTISNVTVRVNGSYYQGNTEFSGTYNKNGDSYGVNYTYNVGSYSSFTVNVSEYETNIPVFQTESDGNAYLNGTKSLLDAVNYLTQAEPSGEEFTIINAWTHGTWTATGHTESGDVNFRCVRGKIVSGSYCLYPVPYNSGDTALKLNVVSDAEFYGLQYSLDNVVWIDTDAFPFDFFYKVRSDELGEFDYAVSISPVPIFADETTAEGYIDGNVDISEAINWNLISNFYEPHNNTGISDDNTEMGHVYTRSFFSQQYICSTSAIQQISNALFDTTNNIFEDIKKGLQMYGERIVDSIQSCMFFPIDLTTVYTNLQNQSYIYFGGYQFNLTDGVTVNKILFPDGYYDFGSFDLSYTFGTAENQHYRDFSPYTRLFCYLAYIGWVELDSSRYMGHTVDIRYYFDTRTGMCLACLFVQTTQGHVLYDYYQGQIGVSMPITLTDYSAYANAQIQTLLGGVNDTKGNMGTVFNAGVNMAEKGLMTTGSAMALGSVGALAVGIGATKTLYGLTQNNINNFNKTKGSSSSMLNMFLPQECMFMFEVQQGTPTQYELELVGYPSNASDLLVNFSGYLEVDSVKLSCSGATDNEKAEIIRQLQSGVYI